MAVSLVCSLDNILSIAVHTGWFAWSTLATTLRTVLYDDIAIPYSDLHASLNCCLLQSWGTKIMTIYCYSMLVSLGLPSMALTLVPLPLQLAILYYSILSLGRINSASCWSESSSVWIAGKTETSMRVHLQCITASPEQSNLTNFKLNQRIQGERLCRCWSSELKITIWNWSAIP